MNNDLTFTFSADNINRILEKLASFPYKEVVDLITDIHRQAQENMKPDYTAQAKMMDEKSQ